MKKTLITICIVLFAISVNAQEIIDAANPNDWSEATFWDQYEMVKLGLDNNQFDQVIKWSNAGINSPNNIKESHIVILYYLKSKAKYRLKDYIGALSDVKKYTSWALTKPASKINDSNYDLDEGDGIQFLTFQPFVHLGDCYLVLNKNTEAIQTLDMLLKIRTLKEKEKGLSSDKIQRNAYLFLMKGYAFLQLKETNKACINWSKAGDLGESRAYTSIQKYCNK